MASTVSGKALTVAAFGARGTGKTAWIRQQLASAAPPRLMVWDFKHDASLRDVGTPYADWRAFVAACGRPAFRARWMVDQGRDVHQQFEAFCRVAWAAGCLVIFVDELPEVTRANRAPPAWRRCVNVGRDYDGGTKWLSIIAAGQRPTEVDKSFLSNCDVIHTGRLAYAEDARLFARMWGIDPAEITNLPDLAWIEKQASVAGVQRGTLDFEKKRRPRKPTVGAPA